MGKKPAHFRLNPKIGDYQLAQDSLIPMGITSENVAERYNVSREKQDKMAMISHQKAARAQKEVKGAVGLSLILHITIFYYCVGLGEDFIWAILIQTQT